MNVGRRLRDVGKTVSGALGVRLGEGVEQARAAADEAPAAPDQAAAAADQAAAAADEAPAAPDPAPARADPAPARADPAPARADQEHAVTETAAAPDAHQTATGSPPPDGTSAPDVPRARDVPRAPDAVLAAAVGIARAAAREVAGDVVGEHLGAQADGPEGAGPVVTHAFAMSDRAYVGWQWAVTLARAEGDEHVTVDEVVLLPGAGALLAPAWLPWSERVGPGDLSPGDLLPPAADDPRLVASRADPESALDAALADGVHDELGLGRARVLSVEGRLDAAERWWDGEAGPDSPLAKQAPGRCADCGFLVRLAGGLRQAFGVCANAVAPDDGRVVALAHGCGAHSETVVEASHAATAGMAEKDDEFELVPVEPAPADRS